MPAYRTIDDIFLGDVEFWKRPIPERHDAFAALREETRRGGGHFCLGANLARREIQVMLDEIFRNLPDLEITGPPDRLQSNFINGIKRMPCEFTVR